MVNKIICMCKEIIFILMFFNSLGYFCFVNFNFVDYFVYILVIVFGDEESCSKRV